MSKYRAKIYITLKNGILDAEGETVKKALNSLGFDALNVRSGKMYVIEFNCDEDPKNVVEKMCKQLLANPVVNNYYYELEEL
ncbi:MAG: phosphoribosylformylglycinamidine synthase [Thermoplasmata archaeon]|nr:phosphoribosylformylglycinamidine synthase subunit PurS [Euryarchaeota archaeon]RLF66167.1 MAG: phosphoribosylformylglycinamidine synthase [Thermoplasmata archaeon]